MKVSFFSTDIFYFTPTIFYMNDKDWYAGRSISVSFLKWSLMFTWDL